VDERVREVATEKTSSARNKNLHLGLVGSQRQWSQAEV
jgi:hypothetical protein